MAPPPGHSRLAAALLLLCLVHAATSTEWPGVLPLNDSVAGRSGDDAPQGFTDAFFLRFGASGESFSSAFNITTSRSCLIQPGMFTADPKPFPGCHQEPFAWEEDGVVQIRCPEPIRWIEEGHEVLINQGFTGRLRWKMEKDNPAWERLNHRAWHSGTPGQLRHTTEFLEVRCGARRQLFVRLRPRPAVMARALPPPDPPGPAPGRRPDIVVLVVDAVSRASFMRLCPQTAALLQSSALAGTRASHRAFVFHHAAALGPSAAFNMIPLFAGLPFSSSDERLRLKTQAMDPLPAGHRWLWDEAKAAGYATAYVSQYGNLFGFRFWNNSFDHLMPARIGLSQLSAWMRQGYDCLGGRPFTDLDFNYTHAFLEEPLYAALPKFIYAHFDQAHDLETRATWLDAPLATAVERILHTQPHTVLLLLSDHGGTPVHLPLLSLLVPVPLLATYPEWGSSLHTNQDEVVSWYDLHLTLRHLLHPDHPPPPLPTLPTAQSLFSPLTYNRTRSEPENRTDWSIDVPCTVPANSSQLVRTAPHHGRRAHRGHAPTTPPLAAPCPAVLPPTGHGCEAAGVPAAFCPCMQVVPLPPGSPLPARAVAALLADWNRLIPAGSSCLPLALERVVVAQEMISSTRDAVRHFDVQFTVKGDSYPVFALKSDLDRKTGRYTMVSATQETRYERYRQCADPQVEITYCICKVPPGNSSRTS